MLRCLGVSLFIVALALQRTVDAFSSLGGRFASPLRPSRVTFKRFASPDDQLRDLYEKAKREDSEWLKQVLGDDDFGLLPQADPSPRKTDPQTEIEAETTDAKYFELGYDSDDIRQIKSSVLEIIIEQGIRRPRRGLPSSWLRDATNEARTRLGQGGSAKNRRLANDDNDDDYSATRRGAERRSDNSRSPAVSGNVRPSLKSRDLDDEDDYDFIDGANAADDDVMSQQIEKGNRRGPAQQPRGSETSRRSNEAKQEQRSSKSGGKTKSPVAESLSSDYSYASLGKEQGEAFSWSGAPPSEDEIEGSKEFLREERARRRAGVSRDNEYESDASEDDDDGPSPFWPDASEFKDMLIDESQWRVNLIGDWSVPFIREETKWRYKLYKNWLQFLDDGLGDGFDVVDEDFYESDEEDDEYYDDEYSENYDRNYQDRGNIRVSAAQSARGVDVERTEETRKASSRDDENIVEDRPRRVPRERPPRNKAEAYDRWVRDRVADGDDWTDVEKEERSASRIMRKGSTGVGNFNGRPSRRPTDPRRWNFDDEDEMQGNFDFYGDDDQADRYYRDEDDIYRARRLRMAQMERARRSAWFDDNDRVPPVRRDGFYDGSSLEEEDETDERMYRKRYGRDSSNDDDVNVDGSRRSNPRSTPAAGGNGGGSGGRFVLSPEEQRRAAAAAQARSNRRRRDAGFDRDSFVDNNSSGMSADEAFKEAWIASAERRPIGDAGLNSRSTSTRTNTDSSSNRNSRPPVSVETSTVAAVGGANTVASASEQQEAVDDDASAPVPIIVTDKENP